MNWPKLRKDALAAQEVGLCLIRKWWRPMVCLGIGGSLVVNGVAIPLLTRTVPDLTGLAAVIAAASPFALARSAEVILGRKDA